MVTYQVAKQNYSIQTSDSAIILSFYENVMTIKPSEIIERIRDYQGKWPNAEVIVNLERLAAPNSAIMQIVWQISRQVRIKNKQLKCLVSSELSHGSLGLFAANEVLQIFGSLEAALGNDDGSYDAYCETIQW